jgi:hypothetical protein
MLLLGKKRRRLPPLSKKRRWPSLARKKRRRLTMKKKRSHRLHFHERRMRGRRGEREAARHEEEDGLTGVLTLDAIQVYTIQANKQ